MKECFENENLYLLICLIIGIPIIHIIITFEYWGYVTVKKYKNSCNTIIQNIITKKYYKAYSDYGTGIIWKKRIT